MHLATIVLLCKQTTDNFRTRHPPEPRWRHLSGNRILFVPHYNRFDLRYFNQKGVEMKISRACEPGCQCLPLQTTPRWPTCRPLPCWSGACLGLSSGLTQCWFCGLMPCCALQNEQPC